MAFIESVEINCCNCGITFWITKKHNNRLIKDKTLFYCPNGHSQSYNGESNAQKFRELESRNRNLAESNFSRRQDIDKLTKEIKKLKTKKEKKK